MTAQPSQQQREMRGADAWWTARIEAVRAEGSINSSLGDTWHTLSWRVPALKAPAPLPAPDPMAGPYGLLSRQKQSATRLGISLAEYQTRIEQGYAWCSGHKGWEPRVLFGPATGRASGLNTICRAWDRFAAGERARAYRAARRAS